jgi:tetratricopeptide (TPR) repeat protein
MEVSRVHRSVISCLFISFTIITVVTAKPGFAQTTPQHKHYDKPAAYETPRGPNMPVAPRLQNLGAHTFPVSTKVKQAQLFINQGVNLAYAFNHAEAARAFAEAARLDPQNPMAYWGHALVLGPNINATMSPEDEPKALALAQKAASLKSRATPRERAYIDAVLERYTGKPDERAQANLAFANAMRKVVASFPEDADARTIFAESLMNLRPWNYWTRDGVPYEETREVEAALARVLKQNPSHPGALHLWIHLWEPTDTPERAEAEADRLLPLMPGAGHIVHMPAHIYQRVGRHADVVKANLLAARADEDYIAQCRAQGLYPLAYYPHNLHFIWMGATASGQAKLALESARKVATSVPHEALNTTPILQGFLVVPYWAMVRFGQWDSILDDTAPHFATPFTQGAWRYARAMALTAKDRLDEAERELAKLEEILADPALTGRITFSANSGLAVLRIAPDVVAGEIAAKKKDWDTATRLLERAVRFEDALIYQEPADWHAPVRQVLGAVLLEAGRADEAEAGFWEDLKKNPESGWSLFGLKQALEAQSKTADVDLIEQRFQKAWKDADITLTSARIIK